MIEQRPGHRPRVVDGRRERLVGHRFHLREEAQRAELLLEAAADSRRPFVVESTPAPDDRTRWSWLR